MGPVLAGVAFALLMHLVVVPGIDEPYYATVLLHIGINIILAVSLNIVNGFTGQFSIGHAGFMAVGGYTAGAITYYGYGSAALWGDRALHAGLLSWSRNPSDFEGAFLASGDLLFLGACIAGGLTAAVAGLVVGLPSLRLRGDYLAIVTLGFGEIVRVLLEQSKPQVFSAEEVERTATPALLTHLGGALGMTNLPFYTTPFWVYLFVAATLLTAYRIRQSTHGRAFLSIREDALAAETMGVPVTRYKVIAFVISAFFAGIAGALFAHMLGVSLNPGELGFQKSFDVLIMVVLGGLGSISGSVLAAVILTILPELLRQPPHAWHAGLALAVALLIFRGKKGLRPVLVLAAFVIGWEALRGGAIHFEIDLSRYRLILYALALVLMMIVRPQGLFGLHEAWELWRPRRRGAAT